MSIYQRDVTVHTVGMLKKLLPGLVLLCAASASSQSDLALPQDYRDWVFLSSGLGMNYSPGRKMEDACA